MTPIMSSRYMDRDEIAWQIYEINKSFITPKWLLKGLTDKTPYRRAMYKWFTKTSTLMALGMIKDRVNPFKSRTYMQLVKPDWYHQ